ncbi:hypothetical protein BUALT_Bualt02G0156700 [Buddleja alternifolia]|uniref:Myb-like domain-containing protein n=1 Tax=Buddleja alternifolia TaxID=168488 RepID=A0AAV6YBL0_9LAMI|nr:hypothetical protein BUALT_Bualt02G0156700 [Buddleja alternifolia]
MQGIVSEALKQSFMDCQLSCTSPLPWVWVIEALARSNQVDVSLLIDLLEKTPEIPNDVGKNAREMVSLRILENFSVERACANSVSSARSPKIRLDPSQSCEDVLRQILSETPASNLKNAASEMQKWDVQPFIQHKRSSSAKYALQQLKAAILSGSNCFLASLKEQSGLSVGKSPEHGTPVDNGNPNDITPRGEGSDANGSYVVHKDPPVENLQPVSRKRRITSDNSAGESCKQQITLKNGCKTRGKFAGKSKHDNVGSEHDIGGKLISSGVDTTLVDNNVFTSLKGLVGPDEVLPHEKEVPHSGTELSNKSADEQGQDYDIEEAKGDKEGFRESEIINEDVDKLEQNNNQRDYPNIGEVEEEDDISSDGDGKNDDRTDVVTKNNASCRPANSPGSSAAPNWGYLSLLADASKRVAQDSGEDRSGSAGKSHAGGTGQNGRPGYGNNECTSSKGLVHRDEVLPNEKQAPLGGTEMLNDKFDGERGQDHDFENVRGGKRGLFTATHENMDKLEQNIQRNIPNGVEGGEDVDISSDSDGYHDERTIIETKKKMFLSSQCTYSQESLAMTDCRELNLCMKCNKSGKLLVCSSNSCSIVIHESCLGVAASFDTSGKFYCPFCAYSRAISKYTAIRKKSALARKDLATFFCSGTRKESKRLSCKPCNENRDFAKKPSNHQCRKKLEYEHAGPSTLNSGSTSKDKQEGRKTRQASQSPRVHGQHHKAARAIRKSLGDMSDKHAEIRSKKGVLCPPEKDLRHESKCSPSTKSAEASEEEREHVFVSKYFTRVKKERKYSYPAIPLLRRKNLPWTRTEEEKLREAMQKICGPHDKVIPWKKILEFGAGTFDKSRNTIDLKDKWRNVCKAIKKFSSDDELARVS